DTHGPAKPGDYRVPARFDDGTSGEVVAICHVEESRRGVFAPARCRKRVPRAPGGVDVRTNSAGGGKTWDAGAAGDGGGFAAHVVGETGAHSRLPVGDTVRVCHGR